VPVERVRDGYGIHYQHGATEQKNESFYLLLMVNIDRSQLDPSIHEVFNKALWKYNIMNEERLVQSKMKATTELTERNISSDLEAATEVRMDESSDNPSLEDNAVTTVTKIETFEIEMSHNNNNDTSEIPSIMTAPSMDESIDEDIVEMESLLRNTNNSNNKNKNGSTTNKVMNGKMTTTGSESMTKGGTNNNDIQSNVLQHKTNTYCSYCIPCCSRGSNQSSNNTTPNTTITKPYRMGNIYVLYPPIYVRTNGWLVLGPHWFGPPFIILIITVLSYYIIYVRCYQRQWYMTTSICTMLCGSTLYNLINTAYRDPGVIIHNSLPINHSDPESIPRSYRFCDTCNYYQPPHAAHCPDCNVCVAGFDHHCVWMSICIGVGNYKVCPSFFFILRRG
jgi:hypothetical protein